MRSCRPSRNPLKESKSILESNWIGSALLPLLPRRLSASTSLLRRRLSGANWPSQSAWKQLNEAVGGKLVPVNFPLDALKTDPGGAAA
jgi:hypothetical protein